MKLAVKKLIDQQVIPQPTFALSEDASATKLELLKESDWLDCETRSDADKVGAVARDIQTHIKSVREMGLNLRRPLKAAQDQIKAIEDDYCVDLETRKSELEKMVLDFSREEARRVAEAERARQAELLRIENERLAAERAAQDERNRIDLENQKAAADAARAQARAKSDQDAAAILKAEEIRQAAAANAKRASDEAAAQKLAAFRAQSQAALKPVVAEHKVEGVGIRRVLKWAITNQSELLKSRPELFTIEIKKSAVNVVCKPKSDESTIDNPDRESFPGLAVWWELETSTRSR